MGKKKTAVIYARKSTEDIKNPGKSIADQIRVCEREAETRGLKVIAIFQDSGISASQYARKNVTRPEYLKLVELVEAGGCDYLIMAEQSRGSRRLSELGALLEASAKTGVRWIIGGRDIDPTEPSDIVLASVQAGMDASESSRLSKRGKRGAEGAALRGRPAAKNLFGYRRIYNAKDATLESVEIVPGEQVIIRRIIDGCLAGKSLYVIANELHADRVPVPADWVAARQGNPIRGGTWAGTQVKRIATSPTYAGKRVHLGRVVSEGMWPAIVTEDEHARLLSLLNSVERKRGDRPGSLKHWLSGLACCGVCGGRVRFQVNRNAHTSYVCANTRCLAVSRTAEPLEAMVRDAVIGLAGRPSVRAAMNANGDTEGEAGKAWQEMERLSERLRTVEESVVNGDMPVKAGARIVQKLETDIDAARRKASAMVLPIFPANIDLSMLSKTFDGLEPGQKRMVAAAFVSVKILRAPNAKKFDPRFVEITAR